MSTSGQNHEKTIEKWMLAIVGDGGVPRLDDLHIDQIDSEWKSKDDWIDAGLRAFRIAVSVRNQNNLPFSVGLGFSLESGGQPRGIDFETKEALRARLNWSPPSLYLFARGAEPRTQIICRNGTVEELEFDILGVKADWRCYYLEFKLEDAEEYCRSVFVEG